MQLKVDTDKLLQAKDLAQQLSVNRLKQSLYAVPLQNRWLCESFVQTLEQDIHRLSFHLYQSYIAYHGVEEHLSQEPLPKPYFKKNGFDVDVYKHCSIRKDKSIISYLQNGVCVGGLVKASMKSWNHRSIDYVLHREKISLGNASIKGDAKCTLFAGKKFQPALHLLAEANASIAQASAVVSKEYRFLQAEGSVKTSVGAVSAQARALIDKNGIDFKAEAGVAAFKGEASASITILGVCISTTGTYEVGSVGIGAEFTSKKGEFTFGGKASLFAGTGFKVHVDY